MRYLILVPLLLHTLAWSAPAFGQVTLSSSTFQTTASATTPACTDTGTGGVGVPMGTASCAGPAGHTAAASASASALADATGGLLAAAAQAGATAPGTPPVQSSNGNASASSFASWSIAGSVHYAVAASGSQPATIQGNGGVGLPPSGVLPAGASLTVSLNPIAFALASDGGPLTAAAAAAGEAEVTFAPVGSDDLIMGTLLAGGNPMVGLLVEALVGGTAIASTQTASDGRYLLSGIDVPVTLRMSDPAGHFLTELSPVLTAPTTYDADLAPVAVVPGLGPVAVVVSGIALALLGSKRTRGR